MEITLKSVKHWHELMEEARSNVNKFRGQSDVDWQLIPKAGRAEYPKENDLLIFKQWKRRAKFYLNHNNLDDWEMLSIAQHTGLPTRLLDWTHNPMVALFFCCFENIEKDGAVFIFPPDKYVLTENNPFELKSDIVFYQPVTSNERLANQYGYFSIHKNPRVEFKAKSRYGALIKIIVPRKLKKELILMLNQYGINFLTLFPDLEGLSKHLSWFYQQPGLGESMLEYE
jgi:hypothetical protein